MAGEHLSIDNDKPLVCGLIPQAIVQHVLISLLMFLATQATTERDKCPSRCLIQKLLPQNLARSDTSGPRPTDEATIGLRNLYCDRPTISVS